MTSENINADLAQPSGQPMRGPTSRTAHTPGPWFLRNEDLYPNMPHAWVVEGATGLHIACFPRLIPEKMDEQITDAHLIAAAPELLAALRIHHNWCEKCQPGYSEHGADAVAFRATAAALTKAEGQA